MTEIEAIDSSIALVQIFELIQLIKQNTTKQSGIGSLYQFVGCLNDTDAQDMRDTIAHEFNKIEGEW